MCRLDARLRLNKDSVTSQAAPQWGLESGVLHETM